MTEAAVLALLEGIFGEGPYPVSVRFLEGVARVRRSESVGSAAKAIGTTPKKLESLLKADDTVKASLGMSFAELTPEQVTKARLTLGVLLVGKAAELAFENLYRTEMNSQELELRDLREGRTGTDYRLYNGQQRALFRINIKFHGSQFRRAAEMVGLEPTDSFALATYKIHGAIEKQEKEGLPYFFAIVGVPDLTGASIGAGFPQNLATLVGLVMASGTPGKRDFEDAVVDYVIREQLPVFSETYDRVYKADWYILSARKADKLLRELLFERVFALRIRNFTRVFRSAELDMHFSLSMDLVPLHKFLSMLRDEGVARVSTMLERGDL